MNSDFCLCDNDGCRIKTTCKRWVMGTDKRTALRWVLTTFGFDSHRNRCRFYVRNK